MTAKLYALPLPGPHNVAEVLRRVADKIDAGEYGDVGEGALVLYGNGLEVFGLGSADGHGAHYLLCCGARRLESPVVSP
ncbi:hypothetical protein J5226_12860 [Lysobacter sp. K5869]|uniref:hypothetical protein n=1 Tax=Lysobacter sp. K5869 TaxID=2820808 RepID=UPI001C06426F|nr:hypothetical protein [Lysobacter sp. K5869]QWP79215.1 hypothetical protein J5226_12860 [Lysobacter sp. K5869]